MANLSCDVPLDVVSYELKQYAETHVACCYAAMQFDDHIKQNRDEYYLVMARHFKCSFFSMNTI